MDVDDFFYPITQDTAATSTNSFFLYQLPAGTNGDLLSPYPQRKQKKNQSKWLNKQLDKWGRNTKQAKKSRSGYST